MSPYQHVIITGGSSGIGKATAKQFLQLGANVSLIARSPEKLATTKAELEPFVQAGQTILTLAADVSDRHQAQAAIEQAIAQLSAPDVLVTSAGIAHPGYFQDLPREIFEQTMAINYFGTLYCIQAALPAMEQRQRGQIVLVSSGAGLIGIYGYTAYCPSKFAVRGLAESLRGELKMQGIKVSVIYPPDTDTAQLEAENRTKPAETKAITASAKMWTAEAVAQALIDGIGKGKFAIAPGSEMSILNRFHSLLLPLLQNQFDRIASKVRSKFNPQR
jgi:3-dehydrosphinganine reductase